jgi:hypothetical protein
MAGGGARGLLFRRYLILNVGQAYMFGMMQAAAAREEPPEKVYEVLAETIGTILADAAIRSLDPRDAEQVAGYLWKMSARISTQFSRDIANLAARQEPATVPGTH